MRQAGRYLPEYLKIREKVSFSELCRSPELIAEVVRQPIDRFDLDAAILFSDILTMLEPMEIKIDFPEGGPIIENPIASIEDIRRLKDFDIEKELSFVLDGIQQIKKILPDKPLIGFVGSPFTLACYLIEGQGSRNFNKAKGFLHGNREASEELFDFISEIISRYLIKQIDAGADAVQIFESWGGILSHDDFKFWSGKYIKAIFEKIGSRNIPRILFVNNVTPYLDIIRDIDCEVIGVDYRADLAAIAEALPNKTLQGNLDPNILFGEPQYVAGNTKKILDNFGNLDRLIFNLGHGILPKTPIESVQAMVDTVHNYR
jgi:uroporphyrinogen decarboxylase